MENEFFINRNDFDKILERLQLTKENDRKVYPTTSHKYKEISAEINGLAYARRALYEIPSLTRKDIENGEGAWEDETSPPHKPKR
jgi:hypothetical protein